MAVTHRGVADVVGADASATCAHRIAARVSGVRTPPQCQTPEIAMKSLTTLFSSLLLSLVLAGSALAGETVNINTADAATIDRVLINVGPTKAQAIVDHRKANGAFRSPEQLALVKGIGLKTVEKNRDRIVIGNVMPAAKTTTAAPIPAPKAVARR
jgi:competence protein ComEA